MSNRQGRGAWSYRLVSGGPFVDGGGTEPFATPYRLRIHALNGGLPLVPDGHTVEVVTTDPNTLKLLDEWIPKWRQSGFRKDPESYDLIEPLFPHLDRLTVTTRHLVTRTGDHHAKDCSKHAKELGARMPTPEVVVKNEATVRSDVEVVAWTDGASRKNPGPSGWGVVLVHLASGTTQLIHGAVEESTNNRMEMTAVAEALTALTRRTRIEIRTDSRFAISVCTEWRQGWKRRGWTKRDGEPPANLDVIQRLDELLERHDVRFTWVRGHDGEPGNELADQLCNTAVDGLPDTATHRERQAKAPFTILQGASDDSA